MERYCIMLLVLFHTWAMSAQNVKETLQRQGFENVEVTTSGDTLYAIVEDPRYRGTFRGAGEALKVMAREASQCSHFELVVEEYKIPRIAVHASQDEGLWRVDVDYETSPIQKAIRRGREVAASNESPAARQRVSPYRLDATKSIGKVDLTFYPLVWLDNHLLTVLYQYGVLLAPALETTLWWGNRVTIQPVIPIVTNYPENSTDRRLQLGVVSVQQDIVNNGKWWARVSAGTFKYNSIGFNADVGVRLNKNLDVSVVANWTAMSENREQGWYVGKDYGRYAHVKLDWFEPRTLLQVQLSAGQFRYGDQGVRMDVSRHFGEYVIGLYGVYTKGKNEKWLHGEHNAGFHFAIPFGGKSQYRKGFFRVKLPEYFDWEYSMVSYFAYAQEKMGKAIKDRPDTNRSAHYWQADYIKVNLLKMLNTEDEP